MGLCDYLEKFGYSGVNSIYSGDLPKPAGYLTKGDTVDLGLRQNLIKRIDGFVGDDTDGDHITPTTEIESFAFIKMSALDWLGPLIDDKLGYICASVCQDSKTLSVHNEPETTILDHGSNFRMDISPSLQNHPSQVFLLDVLEIDKDGTTVLIGDHVTNITAVLSKTAQIYMEREMGGMLERKMSGDVFNIIEATLVYTPYGRSDRHVRLEINALQYLHHLRKVPFDQIAVRERPRVEQYYEDILKFRQDMLTSSQVYANEPMPENLATAKAQADKNKGQSLVLASKAQSLFDSNADNHGTSVQDVWSQTPAMQRRPPTVDLTNKDERMISSRANDDIPTGRDLRTTRKYTGLESATASGSASDRAYHESIDLPSIKSTGGGKAVALYDAASANDDILLRQRRFSKSQSRSIAGYRHPKIPPDQQVILNDVSSWRPSLPGKEFPRPNVPVQLFTQWNALAEAAVKEKQQKVLAAMNDGIRSQPNSAAQQSAFRQLTASSSQGTGRTRIVDEDGVIDIEESLSDESSSDDEEAYLAAAKQRLLLPPDSSAKSTASSDKRLLHSASQVRTRRSSEDGPVSSWKTQSTAENEDDGLKMAVPRPFATDPNVVHRQKRAQFMISQKRKRDASEFVPPPIAPTSDDNFDVTAEGDLLGRSRIELDSQPSSRLVSDSDEAGTFVEGNKRVVPEVNPDLISMEIEPVPVVVRPDVQRRINLDQQNARNMQIEEPDRFSYNANITDVSVDGEDGEATGDISRTAGPRPKLSQQRCQVYCAKHSSRTSPLDTGPAVNAQNGYAIFCSQFMDIKPSGAFTHGINPAKRTPNMDIISWAV